MGKQHEHVEMLRRLREVSDEVAKELGLERVQWAFVPGEKGEPDTVQAVFKVGEETLLSADEIEQKRIDEEFARMMAGPEEHPADRKVKELRDKVAREILSGDDDDGEEG